MQRSLQGGSKVDQGDPCPVPYSKRYSEFAEDGELSLKEGPGSATTSLGGLNEGRCREVQRDEAEPKAEGSFTLY